MKILGNDRSDGEFLVYRREMPELHEDQFPLAMEHLHYLQNGQGWGGLIEHVDIHNSLDMLLKSSLEAIPGAITSNFS